MKQILIFMLLTIILLSNRTGRNEGSTGAPNETDNVTCENCHVRGTFKPGISIDLLDSSNKKVQAIMPNTDYTLSVTLVDSTNRASVYGFQLVPLNREAKMAGSFPSIGARVKRVNDLSRVYLSHSTRSTSPSFTATWRSPADVSPSDSIKFYFAGVTGNDDNNSIGDNAKVGTKTFYFESTTSTLSNSEESSNLLQTNIVNQTLTFRKLDSSNKLIITDQNGVTLHNYENYINETIDISFLKSGAYYFTAISENQRLVQKFVKF